MAYIDWVPLITSAIRTIVCNLIYVLHVIESFNTQNVLIFSPLDHVLRHVPKSHEKSLRQAVYNVLAAAVLIVISFAAYYAFQVST